MLGKRDREVKWKHKMFELANSYIIYSQGSVIPYTSGGRASVSSGCVQVKLGEGYECLSHSLMNIPFTTSFIHLFHSWCCSE